MGWWWGEDWLVIEKEREREREKERERDAQRHGLCRRTQMLTPTHPPTHTLKLTDTLLRLPRGVMLMK